MYDYDAYSEPGEGDAFKAGTWPFGLSGQPRDIPVPKGAVCAQISNILGDNKNDDSNEFTARKYQKQDEDGEEDYDDDDEEERGAEEERIVTKTTPRASSLSSVAGEYSFGGQADTLPVAPGLFVDRVGCIALPLCDEQAEKLIAKCDKSPFGRKLDTMTDENVRKSWQLAPDQVAINNPLWHTGIEKLSETVASRLGYKGVPMQCKLYKMLVYGEGGHFVKHQDTEKEDGMVATLVVQLPNQESLAQMWEEYGENETEGYLGNEGASSNTTYSRYAIVAWPVANGVENTLQFINATAAIEVLQHQKSVAPDTLRVFVNAVGDKLVETQASFDRSRTYSYTEPKKVSVSALFSQTISKLLVDTGDVWLATLFFTKICSNVKEKANLVPAYVALARKFDWSSIGQALLSSLGSKTGNSRYSFDAFGGTSDSSMVLALQIFDGLDDGLAKEALLKAAVSDAVTLRNDCLCASKALGSLWVSTIRNGNKSVVDVLAKRLKQMDPSLLGPVIDVFLQELSDVNSSDDMFAVLASIATMRIEWLKSQIQAKDKPFSWEMPHAIFPDPQIQVFLRGPEMSMTTVGVRTFGGLPAARKFAERTPQTHASFSMVPAGRGQEAFVTITKTRTWFNKQQNDVVTHKSELQCLMDRFGQATAEEGPALKRARIEVWEHRG